MELKMFVISLVIFGMFITGFWAAAGNVAINSGNPVSKNMELLTQATNIKNVTTNMETGLENPWGTGTIGIIYTTIQAGYNVLKNLLSLVDIVNDMIFGVQGLGLPIPAWIFTGLETIFITYFVFQFLAYLRGGKD